MRTYQKATRVKVLRPDVIEVSFTDGVVRVIDVKGELYGEVFEPLKGHDFFARVRLDRRRGTIY